MIFGLLAVPVMARVAVTLPVEVVAVKSSDGSVSLPPSKLTLPVVKVSVCPARLKSPWRSVKPPLGIGLGRTATQVHAAAQLGIHAAPAHENLLRRVDGEIKREVRSRRGSWWWHRAGDAHGQCGDAGGQAVRHADVGASHEQPAADGECSAQVAAHGQVGIHRCRQPDRSPAGARRGR